MHGRWRTTTTMIIFTLRAYNVLRAEIFSHFYPPQTQNIASHSKKFLAFSVCRNLYVFMHVCMYVCLYVCMYNNNYDYDSFL